MSSKRKICWRDVCKILKDLEKLRYSKALKIFAIYVMILILVLSILQIFSTLSFGFPVHILDVGGADRSQIILYNNISAKDPSFEELKTFLKAYLTDSIPYDNNSFVYSDYAEAVHNNAEKLGILATFVSVYFYETDKGHACNAFNTTDEGIVFVDCTAPCYNIENDDATVNMKIGDVYKVEGLFGSHKFSDMTLKKYKIYW